MIELRRALVWEWFYQRNLEEGLYKFGIPLKGGGHKSASDMALRGRFAREAGNTRWFVETILKWTGSQEGSGDLGTGYPHLLGRRWP